MGYILGGHGHTVQIHKSVLNKRKHKEGQIVCQQWIIGMYDITSKKGCIASLKSRSASELEAMIQKNVKAGTEIWTDQWKGYSNLSRLGYEHKTVNYSKHFKDPLTGVCTNHIKSYWSSFKQYLRRLGVIGSPFIVEYIDQFMWKEIYGRSAAQRMLNLSLHISEKY